MVGLHACPVLREPAFAVRAFGLVRRSTRSWACPASVREVGFFDKFSSCVIIDRRDVESGLERGAVARSGRSKDTRACSSAG